MAQFLRAVCALQLSMLSRLLYGVALPWHGCCVLSLRCGTSCVMAAPEGLWLCRPKNDEQGGGGKIIAGMPMGPGPAGSHGVNGGSETDGLISGRKTSRYCSRV